MGTCPACGSGLVAWRRAPASEPADPGVYSLARCRECASARTEGAPPEFSAAHESGAYQHGAPRGSGLVAPVLRAFDRARLKLLGEPRGALLDVGAGRGRFVASARAAGWDARGIEPSRRWEAPDVEVATVESAEIETGSLAAVSVWHVLEHLDDPAAALARIHTWLAPGGTLVAGVPNLDSWQARIGGSRWFHLDLPRHRTHFSARGIERALDRAGFDVERTVHVLAEHNQFGMWQSLVNRVTPTPSWLFNLLKRNARVSVRDAIPTALALPLAPLAALLELAAGVSRHGGTVAVVATKRPSRL